VKRLLATMVLCLLVSCSPLPVRGIVVRKQYRPPWVQFITHSTGKTFWVQQIHHPESWEIVVQSDGTTGDTGQFLVVVPRERFDELGLGDVWMREDTVVETDQ
jgi:hypothetical protein